MRSRLAPRNPGRGELSAGSKPSSPLLQLLMFRGLNMMVPSAALRGAKGRVSGLHELLVSSTAASAISASEAHSFVPVDTMGCPRASISSPHANTSWSMVTTSAWLEPRATLLTLLGRSHATSWITDTAHSDNEPSLGGIAEEAKFVEVVAVEGPPVGSGLSVGCRPHRYSRPEAETAAEMEEAAMKLLCGSPGTRCGSPRTAAASASEPAASPSCPLLLLPQEKTSPASVRARVWLSPAAAWVRKISKSASTVVGGSG